MLRRGGWARIGPYWALRCQDGSLNRRGLLGPLATISAGVSETLQEFTNLGLDSVVENQGPPETPGVQSRLGVHKEHFG